MGARFIPNLNSNATRLVEIGRKQTFTHFRAAETVYLQPPPTVATHKTMIPNTVPMQPQFEIPGRRTHDSPLHYGRAAMLFHWSIAALVLLEFSSAISFSRFNPGDGAYFHAAYRMHMSAGMALLALSVSSVLWRLSHTYPPLPRDMHTPMCVLATLVLTFLYAFIVAVPLTGWAILSARNSPASIFGKFSWPNISHLAHMTYVQRVRFNDLLLPIHSKMSYIGITLVGLHVAASLYHHFWRRDEVLIRMLPRKRIRITSR
jgi:cytochrome b561